MKKKINGWTHGRQSLETNFYSTNFENLENSVTRKPNGVENKDRNVYTLGKA